MIDILQQMIARGWRTTMEHAAATLPKILAGILLLALGIIIARVIRNLAARFFLAIRLDRMSDRLGVSSFLARGDVRQTVVEVLATVIYWLVLLFSFEILAVAMGLDGMAAFFGEIIGFLPRVATALVIALLGIVVGSLIGSAVTVAGSNAAFPGARAAGAVVKYLIGFFALVMALEQLQIATQLLVTTLQIVIAAVAFAIALAFGLGCRGIAEETVRGWLTRGADTPQLENESREPGEAAPDSSQ